MLRSESPANPCTLLRLFVPAGPSPLLRILEPASKVRPTPSLCRPGLVAAPCLSDFVSACLSAPCQLWSESWPRTFHLLLKSAPSQTVASPVIVLAAVTLRTSFLGPRASPWLRPGNTRLLFSNSLQKEMGTMGARRAPQGPCCYSLRALHPTEGEHLLRTLTMIWH